LRGADLRWADLRWADLRWADLRWADLRWADLRWANLRWADLRGADLSGADLSGADLRGADLRWANLRWANLREADLSGADLRWADLSEVRKLLKASEYLSEKFKKTKDGYIVYKRIGDGETQYEIPKKWKIKPGEEITETVNPLPTNDCCCGVNFGTKNWCEINYIHCDLWECLLKWEDLPDVVVPYNTDGKCRCGKLTLLEIVKEGK